MSDFHDEQRDEAPDEGAPLTFYVPEEQEAGTYAHTYAVWHTAYDFIIDFAVTQLAQQTDADDPNSPRFIPARVVSRIRMPAGLVFDFIRTINERMTQYESEWGEIRGPQRREESAQDDNERGDREDDE